MQSGHGVNSCSSDTWKNVSAVLFRTIGASPTFEIFFACGEQIRAFLSPASLSFTIEGSVEIFFAIHPV